MNLFLVYRVNCLAGLYFYRAFSTIHLISGRKKLTVISYTMIMDHESRIGTYNAADFEDKFCNNRDAKNSRTMSKFDDIPGRLRAK